MSFLEFPEIFACHNTVLSVEIGFLFAIIEYALLKYYETNFL